MLMVRKNAFDSLDQDQDLAKIAKSLRNQEVKFKYIEKLLN
jgi:hypothetical protein